MPDARIPRSVLGFGVLGLVPFAALPLAGWASPPHAGILGLVCLVYAALILSFLGGARWGQEIARPQPRGGVVAVAMVPTLAAFALLLATGLDRPAQLTAMAALFGLHYIWDAASSGLPQWYGRLRLVLTGGAVAGLAAMAWLAGAASVAGATMV